VPEHANVAVQSIQELIDALAVGRAEMRRAEQSLKRALERCADSTGLDWLINEKQPASKRQALADALDTVNQCRHNARLAMFALAHEQGFSDAEMGRAWGISRQLASRYVREATSSNEMTVTNDDETVGLT
jgi:response regulator of citrate/malate metabolism